MKPLRFVGSTLKDLRAFPDPVKRRVGRALQYVQGGVTPPSAKPLKGLSGVMEIVSRYETDTYRSIYIANIGGAVYALHCFKKKSHEGIKTPKADIELIRQRLREALEEAKER